MLKCRIFYKRLRVFCAGAQSQVKRSWENQHDCKTRYDSKWLYAAEKRSQIDRRLKYPPIVIVWTCAVYKKALSLRNEPPSGGEQPMRTWLAQAFQCPT
jgi:hypothetical protein